MVVLPSGVTIPSIQNSGISEDGTMENERIGKKHALKKYDQFALNTSCFLGICANSRNFWYKKIE